MSGPTTMPGKRGISPPRNRESRFMPKSHLLWLACLIWLGIAGCRPAPEQSTGVVAGCETGGVMSKAPEMPQGTLLQSVLVNAEGETSGYRIYADGRYETKAVDEGWKSAESLAPAQVKQVVEAVSETEFEQL